MLKVGDTVKVISKTRTFLGMQEFIPIGTICTVVDTCIEWDGSLYYGVRPQNDITNRICFYYLESEIEKEILFGFPKRKEKRNEKETCSTVHVSSVFDSMYTKTDRA